MEAVEWDEAQEETDKGVTQISWSLSQVLLYLRIFDLMVIMCFLSTYFHHLQNCHLRVFACILLGDILYFVFVCHNICIGYLACKDLHPQAVLRIFANQPHHPSDKVLQTNVPISV